MQFKVTEPQQRLDEVVIKFYGDLSQFDAVVDANLHLVDVVLSVGDIVFLPQKQAAVVEDVLW